ncbi:MAG TPA: hypothetical protein VF532_22010 [Candidatus Angelobacter sp.]
MQQIPSTVSLRFVSILPIVPAAEKYTPGDDNQWMQRVDALPRPATTVSPTHELTLHNSRIFFQYTLRFLGSQTGLRRV